LKFYGTHKKREENGGKLWLGIRLLIKEDRR